MAEFKQLRLTLHLEKESASLELVRAPGDAIALENQEQFHFIYLAGIYKNGCMALCYEQQKLDEEWFPRRWNREKKKRGKDGLDLPVIFVSRNHFKRGFIIPHLKPIKKKLFVLS